MPHQPATPRTHSINYTNLHTILAMFFSTRLAFIAAAVSLVAAKPVSEVEGQIVREMMSPSQPTPPDLHLYV